MGGKCQNLQTSFFTFFIFTKVLPVRTKVTDTDNQTDRQTDTQTHINGQAHGYRGNLVDLPKNSGFHVHQRYNIS